MTNFEHYTLSKYKMAMLLAMIEEDANNYPNEINKWFDWLNTEYDTTCSECEEDDNIKKYLSAENRENITQ